MGGPPLSVLAPLVLPEGPPPDILPHTPPEPDSLAQAEAQGLVRSLAGSPRGQGRTCFGQGHSRAWW